MNKTTPTQTAPTPTTQTRKANPMPTTAAQAVQLTRKANARTILQGLDQTRPQILEWLTVRHTTAGRLQLRAARQSFAALSLAHHGGRTPYLFTTEDASAKLSHNNLDKLEQVVQYLSAADSSGVANLCARLTKECKRGCLGKTSGRLKFDAPQRAMAIRTRLLVEQPAAYTIVMLAELERHAERVGACGKKLVVRFNGTSDLAIESLPWFTDAMRTVGAAVLFDYTKYNTTDRPDVEGYYLARSATERTTPEDLHAGMVVIVDTKRGQELPATWHGFPVIDGDLEFGDHRHRDSSRPDAIVLLRAKGSLVGTAGAWHRFVKPTV
jgi:hypothetical protein